MQFKLTFQSQLNNILINALSKIRLETHNKTGLMQQQ